MPKYLLFECDFCGSEQKHEMNSELTTNHSEIQWNVSVDAAKPETTKKVGCVKCRYRIKTAIDNVVEQIKSDKNNGQNQISE